MAEDWYDNLGEADKSFHDLPTEEEHLNACNDHWIMFDQYLVSISLVSRYYVRPRRQGHCWVWWESHTGHHVILTPLSMSSMVWPVYICAMERSERKRERKRNAARNRSRYAYVTRLYVVDCITYVHLLERGSGILSANLTNKQSTTHSILISTTCQSWSTHDYISY